MGLTFYDFELNTMLIGGENTLVLKLGSYEDGDTELSAEEFDKIMFTYEEGFIDVVCLWYADEDAYHFIKWLSKAYPTLYLAVASDIEPSEKITNYLTYWIDTHYIQDIKVYKYNQQRSNIGN